MKIIGRLEMALDFARRKGVEPGMYTGVNAKGWFLVKYGPKYRNVYRITEFDEEGREWLERHQPKDEPPAVPGLPNAT